MSDLDQLDNVAHAADAGAAIADGTAEQGADGAALASVGPDFAAKAEQGWTLFAGLLGAYEPQAGAVLDERKPMLVAATVPVMEKYPQWFEGGVPPELVFLGVAGPALYQAARLVATRMEADKRAAQAKAVTVQQRPDASGIEKAAAMPAHTAPAPERHAQEKLYGAA